MIESRFGDFGLHLHTYLAFTLIFLTGLYKNSIYTKKPGFYEKSLVLQLNLYEETGFLAVARVIPIYFNDATY
jgi:hypothetical protein